MQVLQNQNAKVVFLNGSNTFEPNEAVAGNVQFDFPFPKNVKNIFLELYGSSETLMSKASAKSQNSDGKTTFKGDQIVVQTKLYIYGRPDSRAVQQISAGSYTFPFSFNLPPNAPPTFSAKHGKTAYFLSIIMTEANNEMEKIQVPFVVSAGSIDLRHRAELFEPSILEMSRRIGMWCCVSGDVTITFRIEKTGFKPGQPIRIHVDVENGSTKQIETIHFVLTKNTKYFFHSPKDDHANVGEPIAAAQSGPIHKLNSATFDTEIKIPTTLRPIDLTHCKVMKQYFTIDIKVSITGPYVSPQDVIPIEIGDIVSHEDLTNATINLQGGFFGTASAPNL